MGTIRNHVIAQQLDARHKTPSNARSVQFGFVTRQCTDRLVGFSLFCQAHYCQAMVVYTKVKRVEWIGIKSSHVG
jgi:hypothetical protein